VYSGEVFQLEHFHVERVLLRRREKDAVRLFSNLNREKIAWALS
jgi:hypothetical protein